MSSSYKSAGVDLDQYEESMARLPAHLQKTFTSRVIPNPGGFAGLFRLNDGEKQYRDPVLVSGTDGVGTKLKVAQMVNRHDTVGVDLVAMCVNDVICCGAEPLFFLDYVAMGRDNPERLEQIVAGISEGCQQATCALIGGETAIMPGMYDGDDYDLAGFCVGVVERDRLLDGRQVRPGDRLIGVASSGLHSNGYSLVRKIVFEQAQLQVDSQIPELGVTLGNLLLQPTRIYAQLVSELRNSETLGSAVHGLAHITGGGLVENLSRVLPENVGPRIEPGSWPVPDLFTWLQKTGGVEQAEMERVFNMGIGLVLIVDSAVAPQVLTTIQQAGHQAFEIGKCIEETG